MRDLRLRSFERSWLLNFLSLLLESTLGLSFADSLDPKANLQLVIQNSSTQL